MQMPKSISIEPVNCGNKEHKWYFAKAELLQVGILFGTQFSSLGIFINKKVGF